MIAIFLLAMATTGAQIFSNFKKQVNTAYTGQINVALGDFVIGKAMAQLVDDAAKGSVSSYATDAISALLKKNQLFIPNNSKVLLKPLIITNVSIGANCTITFDRPHNLIANTPIVISDIAGVGGGVNGAKTTYTTPSATTISLTGVTSTGTYTAGTGKAVSSGYIVDDYYHLLTIIVKWKTDLNLIIESFSKNTITISQNNIATGEQLLFSNFNGLGQPNIGLKYVRKKGEDKIQLFDDALFRTPTTTTGTYTGGGVVYRIADAISVKPYTSDTKQGYYKPEKRYNGFEVENNELLIHPESTEQYQYYIDYVKIPPKIDLTNNVYDYEQVLNQSFLVELNTLAGKIFLQTLNDTEQFQLLNAQ